MLLWAVVIRLLLDTEWTLGEVIGDELKVKIGLLIPYGVDIVLEEQMGFVRSGGAVSLALAKAKRDHLLSGINVSVIWRHDQCDESLAAGLATQLIRQDGVHALIGPPCSAAADVVAVICQHYNVPMFSWAATNKLEKYDHHLTTFSSLINPSFRISQTLSLILLRFNWTRVAMFLTKDKLGGKCSSIASNAFKHFAADGVQIILTYETSSDQPTDEEIDAFLVQFSALTRVALLCIDAEKDRRRLLHRAEDLEMAGVDYVYIMMDYVREERLEYSWVTQRKLGIQRVSEATNALEYALFIEVQLDIDDDLRHFRRRLPDQITQWPFYHIEPLKDYRMKGSLYSPFLHDAVYLYAMALNNTIQNGGNFTDGSAIARNAAGVRFNGFSGNVVIDDTRNRETALVMKAFDRTGKLIPVLVAKTIRRNITLEKQLFMLVSEEELWRTRYNFRPTWFPRCGWKKELCVDQLALYSPYIIGASVVASMILVAVLVSCLIWYRKKHFLEEFVLMQWKVTTNEFEPLVDMESTNDIVRDQLPDDVTDILTKGSSNVVLLRGKLCWLKRTRSRIAPSTIEDFQRLNYLREMVCENLNQFFGLCVVDESTTITFWGYCHKGSLQDLLLSSDLKFDWFVKFSLISGIVNGMVALHDSRFQSHGRLKSTNCLITKHWVIKIGDFSLPDSRAVHEIPAGENLWTSPELLRMEYFPEHGTQAGDAYSFGIILHEIICRDVPFGSFEKTPQEIVYLVRAGGHHPFRPEIPTEFEPDMDTAILTLMQDCWAEDARARPTFKVVRGNLAHMKHGRDENVLDQAMKVLQECTDSMDSKVNDRTQYLLDERKRADILVYKFLPRIVAERLKSNSKIEPDVYDSVTMVFVDIFDFEVITTSSTPFQLVSMLNDLFYQIDEVLEDYNVFKIQTINDNYLMAAGLRISNNTWGLHGKTLGDISTSSSVSYSKQQHNHACDAADLAIHLQLMMASYLVPHLTKMKAQLRIGIHTGPVVTGVIGITSPHYCLFGNSVNICSRLLELSKPGCIHISEDTNNCLMKSGLGYITKNRCEVQVKSSESVNTYWLLGRKPRDSDDPHGSSKLRTPVSGSSVGDLRSELML